MDGFVRVDVDEAGLRTLAEVLALKLCTGDVVALVGDLGGGKTTFARALIRSLLGDREAEVPSPTFSIAQSYETPRLKVAHFDLYRLADEAEALEVGLDDAMASGAVLIEWPERAADMLPAEHFEVSFEASARGADWRNVTLRGAGRQRHGPRASARCSIFYRRCSPRLATARSNICKAMLRHGPMRGLWGLSAT